MEGGGCLKANESCCEVVEEGDRGFCFPFSISFPFARFVACAYISSNDNGCLGRAGSFIAPLFIPGLEDERLMALEPSLAPLHDSWLVEADIPLSGRFFPNNLLLFGLFFLGGLPGDWDPFGLKTNPTEADSVAKFACSPNGGKGLRTAMELIQADAFHTEEANAAHLH
jgi:hypothetical protein